jgi:hypothetical protein
VCGSDADGCSPDPCLNGGVCSDVPAPGTGATCDCTGTGYDGALCDTDVDECTLALDNCDANATCANTTGSFTCTCNAGYTGDGVTCTLAAADHYVTFRSLASKGLDGRRPKFPIGWAMKLTDATLATLSPGAPDNPENYEIAKPLGVLLPAEKNDEGAPADPALRYVRYRIKRARQGAGAALPNGQFPRTAPHVRRTWSLQNQFGTISVDSILDFTMLVPGGVSAAGPAMAPAGDRTHYKCYKVRPSLNTVSDQTPDGIGRRFSRTIQAFAADVDAMGDCTNDRAGNPQFPGTDVAAECLYRMLRPAELCNPVSKEPVDPPRQTQAVIDGSAPSSNGSLLCYAIRRDTHVRTAPIAALAELASGARVPVQALHQRRLEVSVAPGNQFPMPQEVDTIKDEMLCVPTDVLAVNPLP